MEKTELTPRKQKLLSLIIEHFIASGEPVGSKFLSSVFDTAISSATIRNEMSELASIGFIEQPHTSAGRVPSQKGYRYYIDNLMHSYELSPDEQVAVLSRIDPTAGEPRELLRQVSDLLSEITGCVCIASQPSSEAEAIERIELVHLGKKTAMIVVKSTAGVIKNRVCRTDTQLQLDDAELFYNIARGRFIGNTCGSISRADVQSISASLGDKALSMAPLIAELADLVNSQARSEVIASGKNKLLHLRDFARSIYQLTELFDDNEGLLALLNQSSEAISISIGRENKIRQLEDAAVVTARYEAKGRGGAISLIGPIRMDYQRIIPCMKFVCQVVSDILTENADD